MQETIEWGLRDHFQNDPAIKSSLPGLEREVVEGRVSPFRAFVGERLDCGFVGVENCQAVAGFEEAAGHRTAHTSHADKAEVLLRHYLLFSMLKGLG